MSVLNYRFGPWYGDEDPFPSITKKTKRREKRLFEKEVQEALWEMEQDMSNVYLILNETTFKGTDQIATEPVEVFASIQGAMDWLHDLASEHDVFVEDDANSVYLPPEHNHIESDEYYIVEMELNN